MNRNITQFPCPVCKKTLIAQESSMSCMFCGKQEITEFVCLSGHYLCETCRVASSDEIIERVCRNTKSADPVAIADLIMQHSSLSSYGVEHHLLVAPVLLTALDNLGLWVFDKSRLKTVMKRLEDIPYGVCGTRGVCGACEGAGCAISIVTGATYASQRERNLALKTTAQALEKISQMGGPRCCKQSVYAAIQATQHTLVNDLGLNLPLAKITCAFSEKISDCQKGKCSYYRR